MARFLIAVTCFVLWLVSAAPLTAQSLSERFRTLKQQINASSWQAALSTLGVLDAESARAGSEDARLELEGPIAFYRGVCEANLGQTEEAVDSFSMFLKIQPSATLDPKVYSAEVVVAFGRARQSSTRRFIPLAESYKTFQAPPVNVSRDEPDQYWAEGPVRWILTADERRVWSGLSNSEDRVAFVEKFWDARASLPGADGRTYREEFDRRVAFADAHLAQTAEQRGSLTDRGMVFVLLGPPTSASRSAISDSGDATDPEGQSNVGRHAMTVAEHNQWSPLSKMSPGSGSQDAAIQAMFEGPGHTVPDLSNSFMETWTYRGAALPAGIPYRQVDVHYVTKRGSGKGVLRPDPATLAMLGAAASDAASFARQAVARRQ